MSLIAAQLNTPMETFSKLAMECNNILVVETAVKFDPAVVLTQITAGVPYAGLHAQFRQVFTEADYAIIAACTDGIEYLGSGVGLSELFMVGCVLFRNISQNARHVHDGFSSTRQALLRNVPGAAALPSMELVMPVPTGPPCVMLQRSSGMQLSFLSRLIVDYGAEVKVRPIKGIAQHIARVFVDERASGTNMLALRLFLEYVIGADFRMAGIPMYSSAATNARRLLMSFRGASSTGAQPTAESELWVAAARGSEGRELGSPVFNPVIGFLALTACWISIFVAIVVITVLRPFGTICS